MQKRALITWNWRCKWVVSHLVWALETEAGLLEMEQVLSSTEQSL